MVGNKPVTILFLFLIVLILICNTVPGTIILSHTQWSSIFSGEEKQTNPFFYEQRYAVIIVGYFGDQEHYEWFSV